MEQRFYDFILICFFPPLSFVIDVTGRMDIDVSLVEDCRRLAKQCKMADLIEELENKCKHVYEFGKTDRLIISVLSHNACRTFSKILDTPKHILIVMPT